MYSDTPPTAGPKITEEVSQKPIDFGRTESERYWIKIRIVEGIGGIFVICTAIVFWILGLVCLK